MSKLACIYTLQAFIARLSFDISLHVVQYPLPHLYYVLGQLLRKHANSNIWKISPQKKKLKVFA